MLYDISAMPDVKTYRPNAAVIVIDENRRVLLCHRAKNPEYNVMHPLQTVQGGIDSGESPLQGAERELMEELGIKKDDFEIIDEMKDVYCYNYDPEYQEKWNSLGQEQHFFLARIKSDTEFHLDAHHREFESVRWGTAEELAENIWEPKKEGTIAALKAFGLLKA